MTHEAAKAAKAAAAAAIEAAVEAVRLFPNHPARANAYHRGALAARAGTAVNQNPYPTNGFGYRAAWDRGWNDVKNGKISA